MYAASVALPVVSDVLNLRLQVSPDVNPELHAALTALPARQRGERIRLLATLGIVMTTGSAVSPLPPIDNPTGKADEQSRARGSLLDQVASSL